MGLKDHDGMEDRGGFEENETLTISITGLNLGLLYGIEALLISLEGWKHHDLLSESGSKNTTKRRYKPFFS